MDKEFIPYKESEDLKLLGFNEPCFRVLHDETEIIRPLYDEGEDSLYNSMYDDSRFVTNPTYQQAFRWFRENYGYIHHITYFDPVKAQTPGKSDYQGVVLFPHQEFYRLPEISYDTYEEVELACLRKLIEIVKEKK